MRQNAVASDAESASNLHRVLSQDRTTSKATLVAIVMDMSLMHTLTFINVYLYVYREMASENYYVDDAVKHSKSVHLIHVHYEL